jgi:hypothetical protein
MRREEMVFSRIKVSAAHYRQALALGTILTLSIVRLTPAALAEAQEPERTQIPQTHLYGESAQANQVGKGYIIFQRQGQNIVGAFHYPHSEFSCFVGKVVNQRLKVVTLEPGPEAPVSLEVPLSQLHTIKGIGSSENNSLKACQQLASGVQQQSDVQISAQQRHLLQR